MPFANFKVPAGSLTAEQKEQVKEATEKNADAIELTVQELEARIAPLRF